MAETGKKKERTPTTRTVLAEVEVPMDVLRERLDENVLTAVPGNMTEKVTVYVELGEATGSKAKAVDAVIGQAEGRFRAPSSSSWRGVIDQGEEVVPESRQFRRRRVAE